MPRFHEKKDFSKFLDKNVSPVTQEELDIQKNQRFELLKLKNPNIKIRTSIKDKEGDIFMSGIKIPYKILSTGQVIRPTKSLVSLDKNKKGELIFSKYIDSFIRETKSKKLKNLVAEAYLIPEGHNISSYRIKLKDGDENNCSLDNIEIKQVGHTGVAIKKAIKIQKDNNFYAIVDSVNKCSELLRIPRRKVSRILSGNQTYKNFNISYY